jgi:cell division transport system permease protein
MARSAPTEIAISRGGSASYLGWVVGAMVYVAVLAAAGALFAQSISDRWALSLSGVVTIQIPSAEKPLRSDANTEQGQAQDGKTTRLAAVMEILRVTPGIGHLAILDRDRSLALLKPWLGEDIVERIDLPVLVDLRLMDSASLDIEALRERLGARVPGTLVDDHGLWLSRVAAVTAAVERGGWLIVLLVGGVSTISVVFAVLSGLSVNRDVVELLHLMGARDGYVAKRFQGYVLMAALPASVIAGALAVATIIAIGTVSQDPGAGDASVLRFGELGGLGTLDWLIICALPLIFALFTLVTARLAALVALRRLA